MRPKNVPLFRLALVASFIGLWLVGISLYWIMMVEPTGGARLVGRVGWGLGGLSALVLLVALVFKPRPRRIRPPKSVHPYDPNKMYLTTWICLPLAIVCSVASVVLALNDNLSLAGIMASLGGVFGGYEKFQRDRRQYYHEKAQKTGKVGKS